MLQRALEISRDLSLPWLSRACVYYQSPGGPLPAIKKRV